MVKCSLEQLKKAKTMATIAAWQSSKTALSLSSNSSLGQRLSIPPPLSPLHRRIVKCGALLLWVCSRNHLGSWGSGDFRVGLYIWRKCSGRRPSPIFWQLGCILSDMCRNDITQCIGLGGCF